MHKSTLSLVLADRALLLPGDPDFERHKIDDILIFKVSLVKFYMHYWSLVKILREFI